MKIFMRLLGVLLFMSCMVVTTTAQKKRDVKSLAIIHQNIAAFSEALMKQDYETVVNAYTADGKIFPGGREILAGEAPIRDYWTPPKDSKGRITYHKITPSEITIVGKTAYDYGYYEGKSVNDAGEESSWKGKYVIVWKEVKKGVWKMYLDIWNRV